MTPDGQVAIGGKDAANYEPMGAWDQSTGTLTMTVKKGVTCNVVCPGPTDTTLIREMGEQGELPAKIVGGLDRAMPIGRMARPDEIAYGAAVFTHDDANFITGQTLSVSGGLTMA